MIVAWSNVRFRGEGGQTKGKREEDRRRGRGRRTERRAEGVWEIGEREEDGEEASLRETKAGTEA